MVRCGHSTVSLCAVGSLPPAQGSPQTAPVTPDIPPLHQGNLVLDEDAIIQLSAGFGGICRDQVDLVVPCVLREGDRQG